MALAFDNVILSIPLAPLIRVMRHRLLARTKLPASLLLSARHSLRDHSFYLKGKERRT